MAQKVLALTQIQKLQLAQLVHHRDDMKMTMAGAKFAYETTLNHINRVMVEFAKAAGLKEEMNVLFNNEAPLDGLCFVYDEEEADDAVVEVPSGQPA